MVTVRRVGPGPRSRLSAEGRMKESLSRWGQQRGFGLRLQRLPRAAGAGEGMRGRGCGGGGCGGGGFGGNRRSFSVEPASPHSLPRTPREPYYVCQGRQAVGRAIVGIHVCVGGGPQASWELGGLWEQRLLGAGPRALLPLPPQNRGPSSGSEWEVTEGGEGHSPFLLGCREEGGWDSTVGGASRVSPTP